MVTPSYQETLRRSAAALAPRTRYVHLDCTRLDAYLSEVANRDTQARHDPPPPSGASPDDRIAFVLLRDATNFGSGWHPHLQKIPGLSGARTTGARLSAWLADNGAPEAEWLLDVTDRDCAAIFGQDLEPPVGELMELFAQAWRQLGHALIADYSGNYGEFVSAAKNSAIQFTKNVAKIGFFNDIYEYSGLTFPFLKRAQLAAYDLAMFCGDDKRCQFNDLHRLTIFADNLVPHVLKADGVLVFDEHLEAKIEAGQQIPPGSPEEIEIRAMAVHATEELARMAAANGDHVIPLRLSDWLWNRGQGARYKSRPRQRTRSVHY